MKMKLTSSQLEKIKLYKSNPCSYSTLDKVFDKYVWNPLVKIIPEVNQLFYKTNFFNQSVSPNIITLSGICFLALTTGIIFTFDNTLSNPLPIWLHYLMIFAVFICQTTDAVDGKHARKTKKSSPLGQLIDHGFDCFAYSFQIIFVGCSIRAGGGWEVLLIQAFAYSVDFIHTWEEYYSGVYSTQMDDIGYTEFQIIVCVIISIIPVFGYDTPFFDLFGIIKLKHFIGLLFGLL